MSSHNGYSEMETQSNADEPVEPNAEVQLSCVNCLGKMSHSMMVDLRNNHTLVNLLAKVTGYFVRIMEFFFYFVSLFHI